MVQTRSQRVQFKLDVRSQKDQGIYNNTSNSLTGASASSGGTIHYAAALQPAMVMTRHGASSAIVTQMHGIRIKHMAKAKKSHKKAHKKTHKKHVRHHRHRAGATKRKNTTYCKRALHK